MVSGKRYKRLQFPDGNEVYCKKEGRVERVGGIELQFPDGNEVYCKEVMSSIKGQIMIVAVP